MSAAELPAETGTEVRENIVRPLEPVEPVVRPLEPGDRYQGQRPADALGPVDLGADPRKLGSNRRMPGESSDRGRAKSSSLAREKVWHLYTVSSYLKGGLCLFFLQSYH